MNRSLYARSNRGMNPLLIIVWVLLLGVGGALLWFGFLRPASQEDAGETPEASGTPADVIAQETATIPGTVVPLFSTPTPTSLPTATPLPSAPPATATPSTGTATVGTSGVNVRSGPDTAYSKLGFIDPGSQVPVIGKYNDWWQISYNNAPGWVFGDLVTVVNAENVPQVQPASPPPTKAPAPASPPAPKATNTPEPQAQPPAASQEVRGLVADKFEVEGAPGPYKYGKEDIFFHMWITNKTGAPIDYKYVGVQVEENGEVQKSYSDDGPGNPAFPTGQFYHRDHLYYGKQIHGPGTYHLWLVVGFMDGHGFRLLGPVEVIVQ